MISAARSSLPTLALVGAVIAGTACHQQSAAPAGAAPSAAADSLRGTMLVTGAEPQATVVLRVTAGTACSLRGGGAALRAAAGLHVVVWGTRANGAAMPAPDGSWCAFDVTEFAVRASDGRPALDGILRADGAGHALEVTRGARVPLTGVPATLRAMTGARIFWVGPTDRAPAAYGVLAQPR